MKQFYTLFLISFFSISLIAQPVLNNVQTGTSFNLYSVSNVNVANLISFGSNVTWDLSTSTLTLAGTAELLDISATPHAAQYPDATTALKFNLAGNVHYSLFKVTSSVMEEVANNVGTPSATSFTNPRTTLVFPFTFGLSSTDSYQKSGQAVKTNSNTYDAYGTLNTTLVSLPNLVRIFNIDNGDTAVHWWNSSPVTPAFQANSSGFILWHNTTTGITDALNRDFFEIFPNPATNQITILNKKPIDKIEIFNINGQLHLTSTHSLIDISGLAPGIYFIKATSKEEEATIRFAKQ